MDDKKKTTTWSPDTKVCAYYSLQVPTKKKKKHFRAFDKSKQYHARHGMCTNESRAEWAGPLIVSEAFCACAKCLEFKYGEGVVQRHVGVARTAEVP